MDVHFMRRSCLCRRLQWSVSNIYVDHRYGLYHETGWSLILYFIGRGW